MDDVWVVIGLLLFGSLLFCLCCYKVTNLLYMLYHIDDSTEAVAADTTTVTTASAVTTSGIVAAIPIEARSQALLPLQQQQSYMNHLPASASPASGYQALASVVGKANSVSSLSVGVQYDPRDVDFLSDQNRYPVSEYVIPANGLRRSHRNKAGHIHVSAPDFQIAHNNREQLARQHSQRSRPNGQRPLLDGLHQYHHHHHHHHNNNKSSLAQSSRSAASRDFFMANPRGRTVSTDYSGTSYFGSLGRATHYNNMQGSGHQISLSESEPDGWPMRTHKDSESALTGLHPPPVKSARLSSDSLAVKRTPRRYGSIRVAECSFVEAASSQPSTPTASLCEMNSASFVRPYHQYPSYGINLPSPASTATSPLPPPPLSPRMTSAASSAASNLCNGPLSSLRRGSNGQHSHIIPPPQNFSNKGEYATLTTTRIGSASSRLQPQTDHWKYQQTRHHHHLNLTSRDPDEDQLDSPY